MPLCCASFPTRVPNTLFKRRRNTFIPNHIGSSLFLFLGSNKPLVSSKPTVFLSKFNQTHLSSSSMEGQNKLVLTTPEPEKYSKELEVAVRAVQMACLLCQRVQESLIPENNGQVQSKEDNSPLTIADWSVKATIRWVLSESFGSENVSIIAQENIQALSKSDAAGLLEAVAKTVNESLAEAPRFGLKNPVMALGTLEVLEAIGRCNSTGVPPIGRFWVLDPVDSKSGEFIRGDQYAIALALIEHGEVVVGVLGCPNYPMKKEWLSYQNGYHRIMSKLAPPKAESWEKGCVIYARKGCGKAWMQPLLHGDEKFVWPNPAREIQVSSIDNPELATFCEPVEKANSGHSFTAGLAHSLGHRNQPLRVHNTAKYAAIACGHAEVFMKFSRAGNKEKIWDHAAGVVIIQEAGGAVTDAGGRPLDFSKGISLEGLDRGVIACAEARLHEEIIRAVDASWSSSCL